METPPKLIEFDVTVSGGTGSKAFTSWLGYLRSVYIRAVSSVAVYDWETTDSDGDGKCGETGVTGNILRLFETPMNGNHTFTIANATVNGTYHVKLWIEFRLR